MNEPLKKGTVIGHQACPGCRSEQPLKADKSGKLCIVCGMCSTRTFYGREPTARLISDHRAKAQKVVRPAEAELVPEPVKEAETDGDWWYAGS